MQVSSATVRLWMIFFIVILVSVFIHELGHSVIAWTHGLTAIPTLAKEYTLDPIPNHLEDDIAAGGVVATLLVAMFGVTLFAFNRSKTNLIVMTGTMASPLMHTLLFLLKGRGHDGNEFQHTQAVLGVEYSGHFLDWTFLIISVAGVVIFLIAEKPTRRTFLTLGAGLSAATVFIALLQTVNNAIFDPLF